MAEGVDGVVAAWPLLSGNDVTIGVQTISSPPPSGLSEKIVTRLRATVAWVDEIQVVTDPDSVENLRQLWQAGPAAAR